MSLSERIAPHIPYLRRYARALCGTQQGGDTYAASVLEAVVADNSLVATKGKERRDLFRILTRIWSEVDEELNGSERRERWEANLQQLTPHPRQALLLTTVESFSTAEAAFILNVEQQELATFLEAAEAEIRDQVACDVLIIEDEPLIALDIEQLAGSLGHNIVGVARTKTEAVELARNKRPGLILADIHLADGSSGIDAVNEMLEDFQVPVIFITAFPERLLTGEKPEPAYLVTKPFEPETVRALISQALFFQEKAGVAA